MNRLISRIRRPVKRQHADDYLLIILLSFATSVAGTRLFLELADYPQLGRNGIHIAHVLWGGLLLFIASLLPLTLANRWVYLLSALLAGAGVGLFIDEVGKFITANNDYFFPAAAPIIYAFFLLTALLYARIRRSPPPDPRIELYHVLDAMEEVLDHDLDTSELSDIQNRLEAVASQQLYPELSQLAKALLRYLQRQDILLVTENPNFWQRISSRVHAFENHFVREKRLRALLIGGLAGAGLVSIAHMVQFTAGSFKPDVQVGNVAATYWFIVRVLLEALASIMLVASATFMIVGQVRRGITYSYYSLILSLTIVNLLVFYFDQFSTMVTALIQFGLLLLVIYYRRLYLLTETKNEFQSIFHK
jgi:hypothetical protein